MGTIGAGIHPTRTELLLSALSRGAVGFGTGLEPTKPLLDEPDALARHFADASPTNDRTPVRMEYGAEFLDHAGQVFRTEWVDKALLLNPLFGVG